jgi:hypothetical protein
MTPANFKKASLKTAWYIFFLSVSILLAFPLFIWRI